MATPCDYKKFAVLYVDDEERSLKSFKLLCGDRFRILTAATAREGLNLIEQNQNEIGVVMTDRCMRGETGIWLLERAREVRPAIIRVLLSDGCKWNEVIAALQSGVARRIIRIPWEPDELEMTVRTELEVFMLQRERDLLLGDIRMMLADRIGSLKILSTALNGQLRELLQAPRVFVEHVPMNLHAKGVNVKELRDPEFWQDLYEHVKAQFVRIDEVLRALRSASEEPQLCLGERVKLRDIIQCELSHLKADLEAKDVTVEDFVPQDLPDIKVVADRLQRVFELLIRYKMARLPCPAKVQIAARLMQTENHARDEIEVTVADNGPGSRPRGSLCALEPLPGESDCRLNRTLSSIIVYQQGGSLDARSEEGKGTTFMIRLPVTQAESGQPVT